MRGLLVVLVLLIFSVKISLAQDTLKMLNGNTWIVKIDKVDRNVISFYVQDKKKSKLITREKRDIFSIVREGKKEEIIYQFNSDIGHFYKLNEMRDYITGEQHAQADYKSNVSNILAFTGGAAAGYLIAEGTVPAIAAPFVVSSFIMIPGAKVKKNDKNSAYMDNGPYRDGYKRSAKGKKFISALKWSVVGTAASFLTFRVIK